MTKLITTAEWGANDSRDATPSSHPIGPNPGVTAHWVGDGYGWPWSHGRCFDLVRGIERHHEYGNGWGDIAYNLLPCPHGFIFEGRGLNVRSSANGDYVRNRARYAVCYLGGDGDPFTPEGEQAFIDAVLLLHREGGARLDVNGHRDGWDTVCPGPVIYRRINTINWTDLEDDMLTPEDKAWIKQAMHEEVEGILDAQVNRWDGPAADQRFADTDVRQLLKKTSLRAERAEVAATTLAKALGPEVEAAVEAALEDAVLDVEITVRDGSD